MTMLQYGSSVAAVSMLALGLVIGSFAQIQAGERGPIQMSQYCAPPQEDTEAPKFYCRQHGNARRNTGRASILADALLLLFDGVCVMAPILDRADLTSRFVLLGDAMIVAHMKAPD